MAATLVAAALIAAAFMIDRYFVHPRVSNPAHADAVIVLAGSAGDRLPAGMDLVERGVASTLVLSAPNEAGNAVAAELCARQAEIRVHCFVPTPPTTRGEAQAIAGLIEQYGWHRVVVVTSLEHVSRARLLIGRCTQANVDVVSSQANLGVTARAGRIVHELGGYLTAETVARGC